MPVRDTNTDRQTNSAENNGPSGLQSGQKNTPFIVICLKRERRQTQMTWKWRTVRCEHGTLRKRGLRSETTRILRPTHPPASAHQRCLPFAENSTYCHTATIQSHQDTTLLTQLVHGQVTIIFVVSVCLSLCLPVCLFVCAVFLSRLWSDFDQTRTLCYTSESSCVP